MQSTAMLVLSAQREIDFPIHYFSNVGDDSEHPDTLTYVREIAMPYAEKHGIEYYELRKRPRGGEQTLMQKLMDPNGRSIGIPVFMAGGAPGRRQCTAQFKIQRVAAHVKVRGASVANPSILAIGISFDEALKRTNLSQVPWQINAYPLIELRLTRTDCVSIIERAGLPVPPKSSCFFCPFHGLAYFRKQKRDEPDLFKKSVDLEDMLNKKRKKLGKDHVYLTQSGRPLIDAVGEYEQPDLFENGASCDVAGFCMS